MPVPTTFLMAAQVTDANAIAACAASGDALARAGAASNPNTDPAVLLVLGHDRSDAVRLLARIHPGHPQPDAQLLQELAEAVLPTLEPDHAAALQAAVERAIGRAERG